LFDTCPACFMTDLSDILFDGFDIHYLIFDMKLSVILLNYMYI